VVILYLVLLHLLVAVLEVVSQTVVGLLVLLDYLEVQAVVVVLLVH
jgi:hypothetical protein